MRRDKSRGAHMPSRVEPEVILRDWLRMHPPKILKEWDEARVIFLYIALGFVTLEKPRAI